MVVTEQKATDNKPDVDENEESAKKKRGAEKEMRKEDVNDDDVDEEKEAGTWKRADEGIISQRKKVKVRRGGTAQPENDSQPDTKPTTETSSDKKEEPKFSFTSNSPFTFSTSSTPSFTTSSSFSSAATFTFSTSFSFSSSLTGVTSTSPATQTSTASIFGFNIAPPTSTSFAPPFLSNSKKEEEEEGAEEDPEKATQEFVSTNKLPTVVVKTGEEEEEHIFQAKSKLFVLDPKENKWHERGVGQLRVNLSKTGAPRVIMRVDVSLRLILNFLIFPSMRVEKSSDKVVRFAAPSIDKEGELAVYSARFGQASQVEDFINVINKHKPESDAPASSTPKKESTTTTTTTTTTDGEKS